MRKLVKIFMTVVAGMMAFSCATDTTDDLTASVGKGQKTVISVSLEESRTYLGGYNEDAKKYPMYWSEGDKISANGVVSEAAVISTSNEAVASFAVNGLNEPDHYFVTYPAVANAEGKWQVKFEDVQNYKNGTFDKGVSTMYGYSEEGLNVQMNHLTGILKIGITGSETVILEKAQISTVDRKPIAGTFDFAFEKDAKGNKVPKLTPTADAVNVIEYIFVKEEGLPLDPNEPSYIHVAVPAGIYDELYVTLYALDGGVMYATVKADDNKPLVAGTVREFKKDNIEQLIEYTPTADNVYIVSDAGTLAGVKNNLTKKVVMVADVDMSGEEWTSIDGFAGEFYGNGYAIKGLKAPLFGTITASVIKGVHLENVAITKAHNSGDLYYGALICNLNNAEAVVENCSASGSLVITGSYAAATNLGGLIGKMTATGTVSGLVNKVNIDIQATTTSAGHYAGCIGAGESLSNVTNCVNLGSIKMSGSTGNSTWIGGVISKPRGKTDSNTATNISNCVNGCKGDTTKGSIIFSGSNTSGKQRIGGVALRGNLSYCYNYAEINYSCNASSSTVLIGGVGSQIDAEVMDMTSCTNYGPINATGSAKNLWIGGVFSSAGGATLLTDCVNRGAITVGSEATASTTIQVGGIANNNQYARANLTFDNVTNYGKITVGKNSSVDASKYYIGGIVGRWYTAFSNANVYCEIVAKNLPKVGMLNGTTYTGTNCKVGGSIWKGDMTEAETLNDGNFFGYLYASENPTEKPDESVCVYWDGK